MRLAFFVDLENDSDVFFFSRLVLLLLVVLVVSVVVSMLNHSELYPFYACGTRCCFVCFFTQLDSE